MTTNDKEPESIENTIDAETLLSVTRQKLLVATIQNTELEALILELKKKISDLEQK